MQGYATVGCFMLRSICTLKLEFPAWTFHPEVGFTT